MAKKTSPTTTPTTLPPQAGASGGSDVTSLASKYGVQVGASTYAAPNDPPVYMGQTGVPGDPNRVPGDTPTTNIVPRSQAYGDIYGWSSDQVKAFQEQLIAAGIVTPDQVRLGARDAATVGAWQNLADQAAIAYAGGNQRSPQSLLAEQQAAGPPAGQGRQATNPEDVKAAAEDAAKAVLGRTELTVDEQAKVEAAWRAREAPFLGTSTLAAPDAQANSKFFEDQVRQLDPMKADARKVVGAAGVLQKMLTGAV